MPKKKRKLLDTRKYTWKKKRKTTHRDEQHIDQIANEQLEDQDKTEHQELQEQHHEQQEQQEQQPDIASLTL